VARGPQPRHRLEREPRRLVVFPRSRIQAATLGTTPLGKLRMAEPITAAPDACSRWWGVEPGAIPTAGELGSGVDPCRRAGPERRKEGRTGPAAEFFTVRGARYTVELLQPAVRPRPLLARLSPKPHLGHPVDAGGLVQESRRRRSEVKAPAAPTACHWPWRCAL